MESNDISATFSTNRIIAFLVAFIMVVVVAIPVVNALTNEQDGGDGGLVTYTNTGDYYYKSTANDNTIHTVHLSCEWENLTETTGRDIYTLTLDDSVIFSYTHTWDDDNPTDSIPLIMPIGWDSESIFVVSLPEIGDYAFCEMNGFTTFTPDIKVISTEDSDDSGVVVIPTEDSDSGVEECSFTVQNGVITYINNNDETVTSEYHMDYLYSTDNSGEYVLADTPFKTDNNSMMYVCDVGILDDSEHDMSWPVLIYGSINTSVLTSSPVSVPLQYYGGEGTIQSTVTSANDKGMITVSKIESEITLTIPDREGTYYVTDTVSLKAIVPTTVTIDPSAPVEVTVTNSGQTYALTDENTNCTISIKEDNGHWQVYLGNWGNLYDQMVYERANNLDDNSMVLLCGGTDIYGNHNGFWLLSNGTILHSNGAISTVDKVLEIRGKDVEIHNAGGGVCDYYISSDGNYVYSTNSKILNDSMIYANTVWYSDTGNIFVSFGSEGTISTISDYIRVSTAIGSDCSVTNVSIDKTDKGGYTILNSITVTATDLSYGLTYSGTADGFIVPKTFTYTESSDSDDTGSNPTNTILKAIPIFLVLGLLVAFALPMVQGKFE